ncbi:MAG: sulfatase [Planctomycetaceae bacterium]|nr:sulfatase [Planctomycetaceae bacterium]
MLLGGGAALAARTPNLIVIFVDDMGYGDLGCFGSKVHATPVLDQMAAEGMRLTDFYSSCSVCTPSRASLMTGCYPRRVNMHVDENNLCVLFPRARKGLSLDEVTVAEVLKTAGYQTMCIGKWHLGDHPTFLPTRHGFDQYFGIPYSNDMGSRQNKRGNPPLPLLRNETVIEAPVQQATITARYTDEAIQFIRQNQQRPFFLYLPHTAVHLPLFPGEAFRGKSKDGSYGDWVEEVDWSTGQILETLKELGIDKETLVLFTTDNGSSREKQGSNLPLRGRKGRTDEGGMRVPCIVRWPGKIPAGQSCSEVCATIDILPTFAQLAGTELASDRKIDGRDIWPLLAGQPGAKSPHLAYFYYQMDQLQAVRSGPWKMFVAMDSKKRNWGKAEGASGVRLFHLVDDVHEDHNVAEQNPEVVKRLQGLAEQARKDLGDGERTGENQRPAGWVESGDALTLPARDE